MKRLIAIWALLLVTAFAAAQAEGVRTTVMVYMCGSNLETLNGSASEDIMEMLESSFDREQISLVMMTGGAKEWQGISADSSVTSIWDVSPRGGTLRQRWQDSLLNMGDPGTLTFFLQYAAENYPADRYALILWDHGGGPLSGICWDEIASDHLTLGELESALAASPFAGKGLEWIGFDACLMASAEVAWRMEPYARYMIASEETEPSYGWNYSFLNGLERDTDGAQTGTRIISEYIGSAREQDRVTLSCIDLAQIDGLRSALDVYFSYMGTTLNEETFSERSNLRKASEDFGRSLTRAVTDTVSGDYDLVDVGSLLALSQEESWMLREAQEALSRCVVASGSSAGDSHGLSMYFPLYNKTAFSQGWRDAYTRLNFSDGYTQYVKKFGEILTQGSLVSWVDLPIDYSPIYDSDAVWLYTQLSPEQLKNAASVRLVAMGSGEFDVYYRTYVSDALEIGEDGVVKALYDFTTLHAIDDLDGHSMTPPIDFDVTDEGYFAVRATAMHALSGDDADKAELILIYERDGQSTSLTLRSVYVYDEQTASYSNRIGFSMEDYPYLSFPRTYRIEPWSTEQGLPGFDEWEISERMTQSFPISTRNAYHLEFVRDDLIDMLIWFEITDTQNNTYLSDGILHSRESYDNILSDDIAMGFTAQSLMIDEEGVYLSLNMANRFPRTFAGEKNRIYFFSPQINGIPCSFDEGLFTAWETEPESLNTKLLCIRWPEGVSVENVESLRFRMLTRFTEYESGEENPPQTWCSTEYIECTWDPALLAGRGSVSMNADCFEIQGSTAFGRMEGVPNYAEEVIDCPITREDTADIVITAPDAAPGEELVSAQIVYMDELNGSYLCAIPVWKVDFAEGATEAQLPGGCLYTAIGGEEYPLYVECDAALGTGTLMTDLTFAYGVEEQASAFSLRGEVSLLYSCFDGTLLHDDLPVAMASRLELALPFLVIPRDDLADGILEPRNCRYIDMPVVAEPEQLPLTLSISQGYGDGILVLFRYRRADGSEYDLSPIPLEQVSRQADERLVPEEEWPQHWTSVVVLGERLERCLSFGSFIFTTDLSGTGWIKDYLGADEELVIPETIGGEAVGAISFSHENPYVRKLILPETIEMVNVGSSMFPEYCLRCRFSQMPNLHTVEVASWELDGEPLPFDWFFLEKSGNTYSYNSVRHVVCGGRDVYFCDGFYYEPQEDGSVTITGAIENGNPYITETQQVIPATLNGMPVKAIAEGAFAEAHWPVDLVLEEGIEVIGARAFDNSRVQTVTLPSTLRSIGENAFRTDSIRELRCEDPGLPAITAYFGQKAHAAGLSLENRGIYHGEYVTADQLFRYALYDDGSACILGYVTQPDEEVLVIPAQVDGHPVVRIESGAFKKLAFGSCSSVILEDGIEELAGNVFTQSFISELHLPSTLKLIEKDAFNCYGSFSEIRIPASVVQIAKGAFGDCLETRIIFTHVPEYMEINGTSDCISILVCPDEIREELLSRFTGNTDELLVFSEEDERQYGDFTYLIENGEATILTASKKAEQLELPAQLDGCPVVRIAPYAFKNSKAQRIVLPDGLRTIGEDAFFGCGALTEVLLPDSLLSLGSGAFSHCDALSQIVLPDSVRSLGWGAFSHCESLAFIKLSASLTELPSFVLSNCKALQEVDIPEGVTTIGIYAFDSCTSLQRVTLPDSMEAIDSSAFSRCWALETIILPAGVTRIHRDAFENCADLKTIVLKGTLETIEDTAFVGNRELISYDAYLARMDGRDAEVQEEPLREGLCGGQIAWALDEDGTLRLSGSGAMTDYDNRKAPAPWQSQAEHIRTLVIGEGIEHIGDDAFYHLLNLETVSFPSSLRSIGTSAFNGCDALCELMLPEGVTHIGFDAFGGCDALESIVLPDGIQEINGEAFSCCTALQSIRLPEGLTTLEEGVLYGCTSLREVSLPSSLRLIEENALYGCTSLTSLVIPDGVTTIQPYAFRGCVNVTSIQIPASVAFIGADIFADVDYVTMIYGQFSNSPNYQFLKIIGVEGSPAQVYAEMYGIRFEPIVDGN